MPQNKIEAQKNGFSRRGFLSRAAVGGLALAGLSALSIGCGDSRDDFVVSNNNNNFPIVGADPVNFPGVPGETVDVVVLNFALILEYLEADLYRQALNLASGRPLEQPLGAANSYSLTINDGGLGSKAQAGFTYLRDYAYVEQAHVNFLNSTIPTLGGTPVGRNPGGYQANFGSDLRSILTVIRTLEEEGVRAYLGAAGFLSTLPLVQTASTIYSTEARHSAALNYVLGNAIGPQRMNGDQTVVPNPPREDDFEYFRTPQQVIQDIQPFLA